MSPAPNSAALRRFNPWKTEIDYHKWLKTIASSLFLRENQLASQMLPAQT